MKKQLFLLFAGFLVTGYSDSLWEQYAKEHGNRYTFGVHEEYGKEISHLLAPQGSAPNVIPLFKSQFIGEKRKVLFILPRENYRDLLELAARVPFELDGIPSFYFSDKGNLPPGKLPALKKKLSEDFKKVLSENRFDVFVVMKSGNRPWLIDDSAQKELFQQIHNGAGYVELGKSSVNSLVNPIFPMSEEKMDYGNGRLVRQLKPFLVNSEANYWNLWRTILESIKLDSLLKGEVCDEKISIQSPGERTVNLNWQLVNTVSKKRWSGTAVMNLNKGSNFFPLPSNIPAADYVFFGECENESFAGTISHRTGVEIQEVDFPKEFSRNKTEFEGALSIRGIDSGKAKLHIYLTDGLNRRLPFVFEQEIVLGTSPQKIPFRFPVDFSFVRGNVGYFIAEVEQDNLVKGYFRKLFCAPRSTSEMAADWQQMLWGLPQQGYLRENFLEWSRDFGFNSICMGSWRYPGNIPEVSQSGMPVHVEYLATVFGTWGQKNPDNCLKTDLYNRRFRKEVSRLSEERAGILKPYGVAGYACSEEIGLGVSEVCFNPATQYKFRSWALAKYGTLARLNMEWGTCYRDESEIRGILLADQLKLRPDNPAQWLDFRLFMEEAYNSLMEECYVKPFYQVNPDVAVGYNCGPYDEIPTQGHNSARLGKTINYAVEYTPGFLGMNPSVGNFDVLSARKIPYLYTVIGYPTVYMKTESNYDYRVWYTILHGGRGVAWYITLCDSYFSKFDGSFAPNGSTLLIRDINRDLRQGLGKMILNASIQPKIGIYRNRSSQYLLYYLNVRNKKNSAEREAERIKAAESMRRDPALLSVEEDHSAIQLGWSAPLMMELFWSLGERCELVFEDQLLSGECLKKYPVLCLPAAISLSRDEVNALQKYVENGGFLVADTLAGIYDQSGRPASGEKLDALFGIKRNGTIPQYLYQNVKTVASPFGLYRGEITGIRGNAETPIIPGALVLNSLGKGKTLYFGGFPTANKYFTERCASFDPRFRMLIKKFLPEPYFRFCENGHDVPGITNVETSIYNWNGGQIAFFQRRFGGCPDAVTELKIPTKKHVYDPRAGKYIGYMERILFSLPEAGHTKALFLADHKIPPVKVLSEKQGFKQVFTLVFEDSASDFVVHVTLIRPDGKLEHRFEENLLVKGGKTVVTVPFSLDDPSGLWHAQFREVVSGQKTEIEFQK